MASYPIHTLATAPVASRPALEDLARTFGFIPNVAGAMAESPVLLGAFAGVFHAVHAGSFSEPEIQVILLTNAVTNASAWPVALHSLLARQADVAADDVQAIRAGGLPRDRRLSALSRLARTLIEKRGQLDAGDIAAAEAGGLTAELVLETILVVAASTITNYTASVAKPPLEATLLPHAWST